MTTEIKHSEMNITIVTGSAWFQTIVDALTEWYPGANVSGARYDTPTSCSIIAFDCPSTPEIIQRRIWDELNHGGSVDTAQYIEPGTICDGCPFDDGDPATCLNCTREG